MTSGVKRRTAINSNEHFDNRLCKKDNDGVDNKSRYAGRDQLISIYRDLFTQGTVF